ncbi:hypothetical protein ACTJKC_11350 [Pedobacter sp. 22226]|uniref:hypothetical protein n=1 Tax=Pedobacter sp. 22226 TaxID=3453894 RepID=UPI003F83839D
MIFSSEQVPPKGLNKQQDGTRPISTKIALQKEYPVAFKPIAGIEYLLYYNHRHFVFLIL